MSTWEPIETASKLPGRKLDLWLEDGRRLINCTWGLVDYDPDPHHARHGWIDMYGDAIGGVRVTHWMPSPSAPDKAADRKARK